MKALYGAVMVVAVLLVIGLTLVYAGVFNVAADDPHWSLTRRLLEAARERSIAARARDIRPIALDDPELLRTGAEHYDEMCTGCHLAPGMKDTELRAGLYPKPPNLAEAGTHRSPEETFWIVKHGVKMTGMPAWGATHDDRSIWALVAFLQRLPGMSVDQYRQIVSERPIDDHSHGERDQPHGDHSPDDHPHSDGHSHEPTRDSS